MGVGWWREKRTELSLSYKKIQYLGGFASPTLRDLCSRSGSTVSSCDRQKLHSTVCTIKRSARCLSKYIVLGIIWNVNANRCALGRSCKPRCQCGRWHFSYSHIENKAWDTTLFLELALCYRHMKPCNWSCCCSFIGLSIVLKYNDKRQTAVRLSSLTTTELSADNRLNEINWPSPASCCRSRRRPVGRHGQRCSAPVPSSRDQNQNL